MRALITRSGCTTEPTDVASITVTLSRRNLENLLHMMDEGRVTGALSARDQDIEILVQGQENDVHYDERVPGVMSWERTP